MSMTLQDPVEMLRLGAPRIIHTDEELKEYTQVLFQLTAKDRPTYEEMDAIELLSVLIERYEDVRLHLPKATPVEVLRFFMEHHGMTQKDLVPEFGSVSTVSLVLSGKRQMTREHIARLSTRFHASPAVFFAEDAATPRKTRISKGRSRSSPVPADLPLQRSALARKP